MYGDQNVQVASCYQIIAKAYQNTEHYRKALEFQEKSHAILSKLYDVEDIRIKNSLATIDQYTKLSVQKELVKKHEKISRFSSI